MEQQYEANQPQDLASNIQAKYKVVFLGDTFVGKTCLIQRFMYDTFNENYEVIFIIL